MFGEIQLLAASVSGTVENLNRALAAKNRNFLSLFLSLSVFLAPLLFSLAVQIPSTVFLLIKERGITHKYTFSE